MPKEKSETLNILTPEQKRTLIKLGDQIDKAENSLALLEELGVGVRDLKDKLVWAKKRRDILLKKG